jgi:hypothetical protein
MNTLHRKLTARTRAFGAALLAACIAGPANAEAPALQRASQLLDLSGISWLDGDVFVAVHDGKNEPDESDRPRVSLVLLPADASAPPQFAREATGGIYSTAPEIAWPTSVPNDLESIARIPGTRKFLLAESGDGCKPEFQRIFVASVSQSYDVTVDGYAAWPASIECATGVYNVESTAVFQLGGRYFFVYAERAQGQPHTELRWAPMQLQPSLSFGEFQSARYAARVRGAGILTLVSLDVDQAGNVYAGTAYDPDDDNGPFRGWVSRIGQFTAAPGGNARFVPSGSFAGIATQDGYKIEGVAVRPTSNGGIEIYVGTDDENYGATMRRVFPAE